MEKFTIDDSNYLEQEGLARVREDDSLGAIPFYEKLVELNPLFENGAAFYDLAFCYNKVGRVEEAGKCYLKALEYEIDRIRLSGYAYYLYEFGTLPEAYEAFLTTYYYEQVMGWQDTGFAKTHFELLTEVGTKLGKSTNDIAVDLKEHKPTLYTIHQRSDLPDQ